MWTTHKKVKTIGGEQNMLCLHENGLRIFLALLHSEKAIKLKMQIDNFLFNRASALPSGVLEGAKFIFETAGLTGYKLALAMDKVYLYYTGHSALAIVDGFVQEDC